MQELLPGGSERHGNKEPLFRIYTRVRRDNDVLLQRLTAMPLTVAEGKNSQED